MKSAVNPAARKSIAVLPFDTRSMEKSDEYFSAGIHDDLLTQLAKIEAIRVISRTSVMQYENTTKPIRQIAAELGVATILEGAIQRAGDRVRINAQLIEAANDTHLWAETWDKELTASKIFEIQSELARLIAEALQVEIGLVYGALGELDLAFDAMDQALEETPAALYYIASDPAADPLRADPRWEGFMSRLGSE